MRHCWLESPYDEDDKTSVTLEIGLQKVAETLQGTPRLETAASLIVASFAACRLGSNASAEDVLERLADDPKPLSACSAVPLTQMCIASAQSLVEQGQKQLRDWMSMRNGEGAREMEKALPEDTTKQTSQRLHRGAPVVIWYN